MKSDTQSRFDEPERDPALADAIRAVEGPEPSEARLEWLRARIAAASAVAVDPRRERPWWEWTTRWARTEVALGIAAGVVALFLAGAPDAVRRWSSATADTSALEAVAALSSPISNAFSVGVDSVVAGAVASGASSEQVFDALVGPVNDEWLFAAAVAR